MLSNLPKISMVWAVCLIKQFLSICNYFYIKKIDVWMPFFMFLYRLSHLRSKLLCLNIYTTLFLTLYVNCFWISNFLYTKLVLSQGEVLKDQKAFLKRMNEKLSWETFVAWNYRKRCLNSKQRNGREKEKMFRFHQSISPTF